MNETLSSGQDEVTETGCIPSKMKKDGQNICKEMVLKSFDIRQWTEIFEKKRKKRVSRMWFGKGELRWNTAVFVSWKHTAGCAQEGQGVYTLQDRVPNKRNLYARVPRHFHRVPLKSSADCWLAYFSEKTIKPRNVATREN